ncbi:MAG: iron chelate uptake ABC transporter family permease subunit [Planctomycetota bacterium]
MTGGLDQFLTLDLVPLLAGLIACVTCALLGSLLVLRRMSLMGDAISHSVLPGIVAAFMIAQTRDPFAMLIGAAIAGVLTAGLTTLVRSIGRVEPGAAMGTVFSVFFALGVLMLERAELGNIELDASCVLHGQIETLFWIRPEGAAWHAPESLATLPRQLLIQAIGLASAVLFVTLFYKELRIVSFDAQLATSQGLSASFVHGMLMVLVAIATVASFEAVGSILVIAMLIAPAAAARLLTDRFGTYILSSVALGATAALVGHFSAGALPSMLDLPAVNQAGAIATASGLLLAVAALLAPRHGVVPRILSRRAIATRVDDEDVLAALYRLSETGESAPKPEMLQTLMAPARLDSAIARLNAQRNLARNAESGLTLTEQGLEQARSVVRKHRLWETYLVDTAGLSPDHVHDTAEKLEHLRIQPASTSTQTDPHGRPIPDASGQKPTA